MNETATPQAVPTEPAFDENKPAGVMPGTIIETPAGQDNEVVVHNFSVRAAIDADGNIVRDANGKMITEKAVDGWHKELA